VFEVPFRVIQRYDRTFAGQPDEKLECPERGWEEADRSAALKWVDLTHKQGDYGVSLLNDSKYGFAIDGNEIKMSLLRGPRRGYPGTRESWTDLPGNLVVGTHKIHYSLYPHKGDWRNV